MINRSIVHQAKMSSSCHECVCGIACCVAHCLSVAGRCIARCSALTMQDHELEALPTARHNLEASMQDVQAKLELIRQLQPLWLRSCILSPPLLSAMAVTVVTVSSLGLPPITTTVVCYSHDLASCQCRCYLLSP